MSPAQLAERYEPDISAALELFERGDLVSADQACRTMLRAHPDHAPTLHLLGKINLRSGVVPVAVSFFRRAVNADPENARYHQKLGEALQGRGKWAEAEDCFRTALTIDPSMARAHHRLGVSRQVQRRWADAESCFRQALAVAYAAQGRLQEADLGFRRAAEMDPASPEPLSNLLFTSHYMPWYRPERAFAEARAWGERYAEPLSRGIQPHSNLPDPDRRLRIGYLSGDFTHHPVGHILEPVLRAHDRSRFEIYCYMTSHQLDDLTARVRANVDEWRSDVRETDEQVCDIILRDGIDIHIDLT